MSEKLLKNKVAIVTGAGQGIGLAICEQLIKEGTAVVLNDIEESLATEAANELSKKGKCIPFPGDVSNVSFIQSMVNQAVDWFGQLDIAIANAGVTLFGDFLDYKENDFNQVLKVNLGGTFFLCQAAANQMKQQGTGGKLLLMSSVTAHQAHKNLAAYSMTKAGIEMLAKNLVIELSPYNINVNAIAPGATLTERTVLDPEYEKTWSDLTPMGRPATVENVAQAASFLVSSNADHITGQTLIVDGGWTSISPSPF